MADIPENLIPVLIAAFKKLLAKPVDGTLAFARCLPPTLLRAIAADPRCIIPGWRIAAVVDTNDTTTCSITADKAVAWREDKGIATLLLVDPAAAGSGMDGIYNAAREITERDLFDTAIAIAREGLPRGTKGTADSAIKKARRSLRHLTPLSELRYICRAMGNDNAALGRALTEIGLWPVAVGKDGRLDDADLDRSARMVERLLTATGTHLAVTARVNGLSLPPNEDTQERALLRWLRDNEQTTPFEALTKLGDNAELWLNRLHPQIFEQSLQAITIVSWRSKLNKPLAWCGLVPTTDNHLEWRLDNLTDNLSKKPARLEVRWTTTPDVLDKGAVEYQVKILSKYGADETVIAEKILTHYSSKRSTKTVQKAIFVQDDCIGLQDNERFDAEVVISSLSGTACEATSESIIIAITDGSTETQIVKTSAKTYPTLALAAINLVTDRDSFTNLSNTLLKDAGENAVISIDKQSYLTCHWHSKKGKVFCPPLLSELFKDWLKHKGVLGRWRVRISMDGTAVGAPEFIPIDGELAPKRLVQASKSFAMWLERSYGPLGVIYSEGAVIADYVNAAVEAWEQGTPELTLIQTLEVLSLSGRRLGLIVLPTHPLRVAWQQNFDLLVIHHRFADPPVTASTIEKLLRNITGANYPAFLPGLEANECFVFADTLGIHAAALVPITDSEPKATVAMFATLLLRNKDSSELSSGSEIAKILGDEVRRYIKLHPDYHRLQIHALRAGDAMSVARALGQAPPKPDEKNVVNVVNVDTDTPAESAKLCFKLDLYPAAGKTTTLTGRFLSTTVERYRSKSGFVPDGDRWLLETVERPGGITLPKLRWARRDAAQPETPAHLALAFDLFNSKIVCQAENTLPVGGVLEAHGLALMPTKEFQALPNPRWLNFISPELVGNKHPVARGITERQIRLHNTILRATARHLGGEAGDWPVLVTEVSASQDELLHKLHCLCDWVITIDRNAGVEYFDSPTDLPKLYSAYIIDCVPERDDLGFLQLITSTSRFEEIEYLLETNLRELGLAVSKHNCELLLNSIKGVSGRIVLRLTRSGTIAQEMIALALVNWHCKNVTGQYDPVWLSLNHGFFIPIDDVPELLHDTDYDATTSQRRSDLLYVSVNRRGLLITILEVKFRRDLTNARSPELITDINTQLESSCERWERRFGAANSALAHTINRASLARILRFYARKGRRHGLNEGIYQDILSAIDRLVKEPDYPIPSLDELHRIGYVFCAEYRNPKPDKISDNIWIFGPDMSPLEREQHLADAATTPTESTNVLVLSLIAETTETTPSTNVVSIPEPESITGNLTATGNSTAIPTRSNGVVLGHQSGGTEAVWKPAITGNPHLLIIGNSGMGKTNSLINLCLQLNAQNISPIIFSYHADIDERLAERLPQPPLLVRYNGLGFNPLVVPDGKRYLDSAAMLRDLFAAIFPDLGDVQLGHLRTTLNRSYQDQGWDEKTKTRGITPAFRTFYELLQNDPKSSKTLLTRLEELDDNGLFSPNDGSNSVLERRETTLIQIHDTQNEALQRAFAILTLYNIYQNMFRRGLQTQLTHAVIFDEAHKAAKLKLIATMAKECRKYGLSLVLASQELKDFDPSVFTAIANYLVLRVDERDARQMAKRIAPSNNVKSYTDRIKQLEKYHAVYYGEGLRSPISVALLRNWIAEL